MSYATDIKALSPDHLWDFDGDSVDQIAANDGTTNTTSYTGSALCMDASNSMSTDDDADASTVSLDSTIDGEIHRHAISGWFMTDAIQQPPTRMYGEGDATQSMSIFLGWGNTVCFEIDDDNNTLQIYGNFQLTVNRAYHLTIIFESNSYGNEFRAYLDGVKQTDSVNTTPNNVLTARTAAASFGGSTSTTDIAMGGVELKMVSSKSGYYNYWASWSGENAQLTDTEIFEELFSKGALPDTTITNQSGLDALADTVQGDVPLAIRVTGDGTINLSADNIKFSDRCSLHVQYTGTGTLNWTNTNGSNATVGSATGGGTLNFINPATLTINNLVTGSKVSIFDDEVTNLENFDTRLQYTASSGTSVNYSHSGAVNTIIITVIKTGYEEEIITFPLNSTDQTIDVYQIKEMN